MERRKMDILEQARKLRRLIESMAVNLDDETALDNIDVFPNWAVGVSYEKDFRVRYNEVLYKVLQNHTSQEDWTPDVAVSLYVNIADPQEEFPEWVQPTGSHDAYNTGDKVSHNSKHWISLVDANVWEPTDEAITLWENVPIENEPVEEPEVPEEPTVPEFVQPTSPEDAYNTGDRVLFNGLIYESLIDNNVWSPEAYPQGWQNVEVNNE